MELSQTVQLALIMGGTTVIISALAFWAARAGVNKVVLELGNLKLSINGHMTRVIEALEKAEGAKATADAALQVATSIPTNVVLPGQAAPRSARSTDRKPETPETES